MAASLASACSGGVRPHRAGTEPDGCSDRDGDGFGLGPACGGPDCNDFVAGLHADAECDAWCAEHGDAPGCPCDGASEPVPCYLGPPGTEGVGPCGGGATNCADGRWGACVGEVVPVDETCDGVDQSCDGVVDDGPDPACGACGPCGSGCSGPDCGGWGDPLPPGVVETPEGWLTLDGAGTSAHVLWPSSSSTGEIFRVSTRTREIEAGFWTGPHHGNGEELEMGDSPSRSAVDDFGDVIVANRGFNTDASITKIARNPDTCPDTNGNGEVDTSTGWADRLPFDARDHWEDECILWHTVVGARQGVLARAVAIHSVGGALDGASVERGWVGIHEEERFLEFDPQTGELTGAVAPTRGITPYGAAIDRDGWLWLTAIWDSKVGFFDTADPEDSFDYVFLPDGYSSYRVIVDENNRPWVTGVDAYRWDPHLEAFEAVGLAKDWRVRLGTPSSDGRGSIWIGAYMNDPSQFVYRVSNDAEMSFHQVPTPGVETFGTAADFDGQVWAFSYFQGKAAVIDVETERSEVALDDCGGQPCLHHPYIRGDITGLQRRNALVPAARWSHVYEGCTEGETNWRRATVDGVAPPGADLVVSARTADALPALGHAAWIALGSAAKAPVVDLDQALASAGVDDGRYLEVQVLLQPASRQASPTLRGVAVHYACPDVVD